MENPITPDKLDKLQLSVHRERLTWLKQRYDFLIEHVMDYEDFRKASDKPEAESSKNIYLSRKEELLSVDADRTELLVRRIFIR